MAVCILRTRLVVGRDHRKVLEGRDVRLVVRRFKCKATEGKGFRKQVFDRLDKFQVGLCNVGRLLAMHETHNGDNAAMSLQFRVFAPQETRQMAHGGG